MSIRERLAQIDERITSAASDCGRSAKDIELLVVSKTFAPAVVLEAVEAGYRALGENRVQEALEKQGFLPPDVQWHLIGPLQRNKVRKVVGKFACLQGVDSLKLAVAIDRIAEEFGVVQPILLQIRVGGEASKSGYEAEVLRTEIEELARLSNVKIEGLMTIPPPAARPEEARPYFAVVRELRNKLSEQVGLPLKQLSMGMSGDYQAAIREGSTMVRVGSAIFGGRG